MKTLKEIKDQVGAGVKVAVSPLTERIDNKLDLRAGTAAQEQYVAQIGRAARVAQRVAEAEAKAQAELEEADRVAVESAAAATTAAEMDASIRIRLNAVAEIDASLLTSSLEVLLRDSKAADRKRGEVKAS